MIVAATLLAVKRFKAMVESVVGIGAVRALVEYEPDSGEDVNNVDAMDDNDSVDIIGYTLDEKDNKIIRTNNSFHLHEEVEKSTVSGINFKTTHTSPFVTTSPLLQAPTFQLASLRTLELVTTSWMRTVR